MIEYHTIDKESWGPGPWQDEPDKIQYTDEATGLPCLVKRNPNLGQLCGYVGVPESHPLYGADNAIAWTDNEEERSPVYDLDVHGGITYAALCSEGDESTSICHIPEAGEPDNVWWLGWDCGHCWDKCPAMDSRTSPELLSKDDVYRDINFVKEENSKLAKQLIEMGD